MKGKSRLIQKKEEIQRNPDNKISDDRGEAGKQETITPPITRQRIIADLHNIEGEKRIYREDETDEQDSDGSANAFEDK